MRSPFLLLKANLHSQHHPRAVEAREKEKTARGKAKATRAHLKVNQVSKLLTRSTRTQPSTGSSFMKPTTRRVYATSSKKVNVSRARARETIVVLGVDRLMSRTSLAVASKTWLRSEQRHLFVILRQFRPRVHLRYFFDHPQHPVLVKSIQHSCRVLLVADNKCHETDFLEAWRQIDYSDHLPINFELVFSLLSCTNDLLLFFTLLDHVR